MGDGLGHSCEYEEAKDHAERDAIISIIEGESEAWLRGDLEAWKKCWKQEEGAQHISARPSVGAQMLIGFNEIEHRFRPMFAEIAAEARPNRRLVNENWRITIGTDMAWATFEQVLPIDRETVISSGRHHQMRVLEKIDGAWKIAALFQIPNRYGYYLHPWVRVDSTCHVIDEASGLSEAMNRHAALRIVGDRLCGHAKADTRKLQEAVRQADSRVNNRKSSPPVPVILNDADGIQVAPCWVTIADMMIVVLLQDDDLLNETIARAGRAYGLSKTQVRVASLISQGHDLSVCATKLGVQPNTVRTHVRRMFDRVGVNSQPALVKTLLSIRSPR